MCYDVYQMTSNACTNSCFISHGALRIGKLEKKVWTTFREHVFKWWLWELCVYKAEPDTVISDDDVSFSKLQT